ncbi:MAG: GHMP kinase [Planctomycetes bacterium]|nr:GHMP kinase [Planctomycetota bacterium]
MYRVTEGSTQGLPDVQAFLDLLGGLHRHPIEAARGLFDPTGELIVTRAPGRLDVMGGIADYSGSLVLEMPIREGVLVALQPQRDRSLRIVTLADETGRDPAFEMPLAALESPVGPMDYAAARAWFASRARTRWAAYIAGAFLVLMRECGAEFPHGARILVASEVPEGRGVASSAALEVAAMQAVAAAYDIRLEPVQLAGLCQMVENLVVGAPCGIMDQITAACGEQDRLLALLCQPAEMQGTIAIPDDIEFWGLDSGVRHSVSGADYGSVRVGAFMGYRIIAEHSGMQATAGRPGGPVTIDDPAWHGYLANIYPSYFETHFHDVLPERISGREFLARYGGTTDPVTSITPARTYAVRNPAAHPIQENFRVRVFAEMLKRLSQDPCRTGVSPGGLRGLGMGDKLARTISAKKTPDPFILLGELMYQSHAGYSACGLGCDATDFLVDLVRYAGPAEGLYGAKITGGGNGGTVAVLARRGSAEAIHAVAEAYARRRGYQPYIFSGSSPGACSFGHLRLWGTPKSHTG